MNKARFLRIADHIEAEPKSFDMSVVLDRCGTVGCIMGQAIMLFVPASTAPLENYHTGALSAPNVARDLLDVDEYQARELFYAESLDLIEDNDAGGTSCVELGYDIVQEHYRSFVPAALRWMVQNDLLDWEQALDALGVLEK